MLDVQVWSDVVCPWCAVGRARFGRALTESGLDADVTWRSFELDPSAPQDVEGPYVERLAGKYGTTVAQAQQMVDRMVATGAEEGIEFRFDRVRPGNTFDAHRVLHLAREDGRQGDVKARFLDGYHTEGVAIGHHDELVRLAAEAGLEAARVREVLDSGDFADAVRADEAEARRLEITGVPFFLLAADDAGPYGVPGAQPTDVFRRVLHRVGAEIR